jgi:hypothetical protein
MITVSDPDGMAPQSKCVLALLGDLSDAMLVAAGYRNDDDNLFLNYGMLLAKSIEHNYRKWRRGRT